SQYVSGKTLPRADVAALLSDLLEVPTPWLMGESGDLAGVPAGPDGVSFSAATPVSALAPASAPTPLRASIPTPPARAEARP
ncbi:hypothetical protein RFY10_09445, partial [Acinetobacter baumannii]|nr:hypothetical protein [Acinetobacter baumannii]